MPINSLEDFKSQMDSQKFIAYQKKKVSIVLEILKDGCDSLKECVDDVLSYGITPDFHELVEQTLELVSECVYFITGSTIEYKTTGTKPNLKYIISYEGENICDLETKQFATPQNEEETSV